jgi:predicted ATPase/DNA-binding SARP family transcriptional activator
MHVAVLGPLEVALADGPVALGAPKERAVLEMLALRPGQLVPTQALWSGLWGDSAPPSAAKVLQSHISHLRHVLPPGAIATVGSGYVLQLDRGAVDASRFERSLQEAAEQRDAGNLAKAVGTLVDGLGLWRGQPCPELTEHSWASAAVARLEELRRQAEDDLAELRLALGEHDRLVGDLEAALYRAGRQADALRAYARLQKNLAEQLGISPSAELVALERSVLEQSDDLDYRPSPAPVPGSPRTRQGALRGTLPSPADAFVGRAEELAEVADLVVKRRLVMLAGPAGCGKTRLSIEVATKLSKSFAGGVHFAALVPVTDPTLVPTAVADALGVRPESARPLTQVISELVGHRETLVVVDNCEHVVEAAAVLVDELLQGAPGLRVLATSRDPLRIAGETVWRVAPLEVPEPGAGPDEARRSGAVELFVDRALAAQPRLCLDDDAIPTVAEVARRLDGIPLAIELAAARLSVLELESILDGLTDRFALLTGGPRTAPARQQTLRAAVAWSYELLSPSEQDLFCRLSVFPGSFSMDAAVAVAGPSTADPVHDLFALVSKSMVTTVGSRPGPARYGLLETLREFGAAQPGEPNRRDDAQRAHANFYLALVHSAGPEPFGASVTGWCEALELEFHNLRAVFAYLEAEPGRRPDLLEALTVMRLYWDIRRRREGLRLLEQALARPGVTDDPRLRARALVTAAEMGYFFDVQAGERYAHSAMDLANRTGDKATAAFAAAMLAEIHAFAGVPDEAEGYRALQAAREIGGPVLVGEGIAAAFDAIADISAPDKRARQRVLADELLAMTEAAGDCDYGSTAHRWLGLLSIMDGDLKEARRHVELHVALAQRIGGVGGLHYWTLANVQFAEGDLTGALETVSNGVEWARRQDATIEMGILCADAAACATRLGAYDPAARLYGFSDHELEAARFRFLLVEALRHHSFGRGGEIMEPDLEVLRAQMGDGFEVAYERGRAMNREEVAHIVSALGEEAQRAQLAASEHRRA